MQKVCVVVLKNLKKVRCWSAFSFEKIQKKTEKGDKDHKTSKNQNFYW